MAGTSTAAPGAPAGPAGVAGVAGGAAGDDSVVVAEAVVVVVVVGEVTLFNSGTESSLLSRIAENTQILVVFGQYYVVGIATNPSCPRCVRSSRQPPAFAPQRPRRV